MKRKMSEILSLLMAACMTVSLITPAFASESETYVQTEQTVCQEMAEQSTEAASVPETSAQNTETTAAKETAGPSESESQSAGSEAPAQQTEQAADTEGQSGTVPAAQTEASDASQAGASSGNTEAASEKNSETVSEPESEVSYPTLSFEDHVTENGLTVKISADEGAFPEGTTVELKPVSSGKILDAVQPLYDDEKTETVDAAGVEITFSQDGKEIQPANGSKVRVKLSSDAQIDGDDQQVVHIDDYGKAEEVDAIKVDDESADFFAEQFSIYAIIGTDKLARRTYHFYNSDADDAALVYSQVVKNGDTLVKPADPEKEGKIFTGWFAKDDTDGQNPFAGFGKVSGLPTGENAKDDTVNLYAHYTEAFYVRFHGLDGEVIRTKKVKSGDSVNTSDVSFQTPSGLYFCGWTTSPDGSVEDTSKITEPVTVGGQDIELYPVIKDVVWVIFDSNNKEDVQTAPTVTAVQCVKQDDSVNKPQDPVRSGYEFVNWSVDQEGNQEYDFTSQAVTYSQNDGKAVVLRLYAQWNGNETHYMVRVWTEELTNTNHEYNNQLHESGDVQYRLQDAQTFSAKSGSKLDPESKEVQDYLQKESKNNDLFHFELRKKDPVKTSGTTVAGDGSSAVDVYYDLKIYTVNFKPLGKNRWGNYISIVPRQRSGYIDYVDRAAPFPVSDSYSINSVTFETNNQTYSGNYQRNDAWSFQARFGERVDYSIWQDYRTGKIDANKWSSGAYYGLDMNYFLGDSVPFGWAGSTSCKARPGRWTLLTSLPTDTMSDWMIPADSKTTVFNCCLVFAECRSDESLVPYEITEYYRRLGGDGYDIKYSTEYGPKVSRGWTVKRGDSKAWKLVKSEGPVNKYGDPDLSNVRPLIEADYQFWYERQNITLCFYNVNHLDRVYEGDGQGTSGQSSSDEGYTITGPGVLYGDSLAKYNYTPSKPESLKGTYTFGGWYDNKQCDGEPFDFSQTMGEEKLTLYAKWIPQELIVDFDSAGGTAVSSQTVHYGDMLEKPQDPTREGYAFDCWYKKDGTEDAEPFSFEERIAESMTLTAHWIKSIEKVRVRYVSYDSTAADGVSTQEDDHIYQNNSIAVVKKAASEAKAPAGYIFAGWKDTSGWNGEGTVYRYNDNLRLVLPDDKITLTTDEDGRYIFTLTAIYQKAPENAALTYYANNGETGDSEPTYTVSPDPANNADITLKSAYDTELSNFRKDGYRFIGWNTDRDGSGKSYTAGGKYGIDTNKEYGKVYSASEMADAISKDKEKKPDVLYAQWELLHKLTVMKDVDGDYVDKANKKFSFTVTFTGGDPNVNVKVGEGNEQKTYPSTNGTVTFDLKDGESIVLKDIPDGTAYTVSETPDSDYSTTYSLKDSSDSVLNHYTGKIQKDDVYVLVTNKSKVVVTGVELRNDGLVALLVSLMILAGAAYAAVSICRRRRFHS